MVFLLHRTRLEKAKKEQEDRLEYIKEQLEMYSHDAKRHIKEITTKVEGQVNYNVTLNLEAWAEAFFERSTSRGNGAPPPPTFAKRLVDETAMNRSVYRAAAGYNQVFIEAH